MTIKEKLTNRNNLSIIMGLVLAIIPLAVLIGLLMKDGFSITNKRPVLSDEVFYWMQAETFSEVGFDGGYYTANEVPAKLEFTHFYTWGPGVPVFYGAIAKIIGWEFYYPIVINMLFLGLGAFIFAITIRPNKWQFGLAAILLATFPALLPYGLTTMVVVLNAGIGVFLASILYKVAQDDNITVRLLTLCIAGVILFSLIHITWIFFLIPLAIIFIVQKPTLKRFSATTVIFLTLMILTLVFYFMTSAPYPNTRSYILEQFSISFSDGFTALTNNIGQNLATFTSENQAILILRWQLLTIVVYALYRLFISLIKKERQTQTVRLALIYLISLGTIFIFVLTVHNMTDWRDFRMFAPFVLLSLLLLIAEKRYWLTIGLIVISFLSYRQLQPLYTNIKETLLPFYFYTESLETTQQQLEEIGVLYTPDAPNPWCNTVLFSQQYFDRPFILLAFDAGLGKTYLRDNPVLGPNTKSQYILLTDDIFLPEGLELETLLEFENGHLYRNNNVDCTPVPSD